MIAVRRASQRGHADHGWLNTFHTFSFADYYDEEHMGFRSLRVLNDDTVSAGQGFGTHGHKDMEIVSYVLEGALSHKDSMGTGSTIKPGDVQRMSAGTGVMHSEFNGSKSDPVHFLQIWLLPDKGGIAPGYEQKNFSAADKRGQLKLIASPDGRDGSVTIHTDAKVYAGTFDAGQKAELSISKGRGAWVHVAQGTAKVNGQALAAGDGVALEDESAVSVEGVSGGEVLVFDLR
ncbi:MAG: pirin family protein [Myxococcaceae bacterium]